MPLYEYLCEKCGSKFELIEKFSAEPKTVHEGCGGSVHRLISAPAFHLKGSGWYATDYAKSGSSKPPNAGGDSKKSDEGKSNESKSPDSSPSPSTSSNSSTSTSTPASTSSSSSSDSGGSKSS